MDNMTSKTEVEAVMLMVPLRVYAETKAARDRLVHEAIDNLGLTIANTAGAAWTAKAKVSDAPTA